MTRCSCAAAPGRCRRDTAAVIVVFGCRAAATVGFSVGFAIFSPLWWTLGAALMILACLGDGLRRRSQRSDSR